MKKYNTMSAAIEGTGLGYVEPIEDVRVTKLFDGFTPFFDRNK